MKVEYIHGISGEHASNIIWAERDKGNSYYSYSRFAMNGGKFPADHPACPNSKGNAPGDMMQSGRSEAMDKFRALGYWASCFPEGDGITMQAGDKTAEEVAKDIARCFGWEVEIKK